MHIQYAGDETDDTVAMILLTALSNGTTLPGFGPRIQFQAQRNNGVNQNVGMITSVAEINSGADISSGLGFWTGTAGVNNEKLRITYDGRGDSDFTIRAWVSFDGTGTVAIHDSHNVSSVTDHATGDYTVNFSTSMPSADFASAVNCGMGTAVNSVTGRMAVASHADSGFRIGIRATADQAWTDEDFVSGIFVGG
jgi:hypothetical protein